MLLIATHSLTDIPVSLKKGHFCFLIMRYYYALWNIVCVRSDNPKGILHYYLKSSASGHTTSGSGGGLLVASSSRWWDSSIVVVGFFDSSNRVEIDVLACQNVRLAASLVLLQSAALQVGSFKKLVGPALCAPYSVPPKQRFSVNFIELAAAAITFCLSSTNCALLKV